MVIFLGVVWFEGLRVPFSHLFREVIVGKVLVITLVALLSLFCNAFNSEVCL